MRKIISSPGSYIQGSGELSMLAEHYTLLGRQGAYIIVDKFIHDTYQNEIISSFKEKGIRYELAVFGGECSRAEIEKHQKQLADCDVIVGIGGGKTLDTAKAVAFYGELPMMIVPTAASTDAPCSHVSVIYTESGEFEAYLMLNKNPDMVIMDTKVIANAPARFLAAGIGDALATYYEAAACKQADAIAMSKGHVTLAAAALADLCLKTLLADGYKAMVAVENKVCTAALENIIEANTYLSGIGFESGGLSAAHAIHNGLTVLEECHHMLHGEKVTFGTITQMVLENRSMEEIREIIEFCKSVGLPTSFKDLGIDGVSDDRLLDVAKASCAENDTMINMPFEVTPEDVVSAMKVADRLGSS